MKDSDERIRIGSKFANIYTSLNWIQQEKANGVDVDDGGLDIMSMVGLRRCRGAVQNKVEKHDNRWTRKPQ